MNISEGVGVGVASLMSSTMIPQQKFWQERPTLV
jgi:hypothetical protein